MIIYTFSLIFKMYYCNIVMFQQFHLLCWIILLSVNQSVSWSYSQSNDIIVTCSLKLKLHATRNVKINEAKLKQKKTVEHLKEIDWHIACVFCMLHSVLDCM